MNWIWQGLYYALAMLWETFWALVLGFGISALLQVMVSKERMSRTFGLTNLKSVALATGLGAASSSCSYAAAAAGRSAFQQGAALIPVIAFMFASTNLVIELGAMIFVLLSWHFVLAEVIGALVLIGVMWFLALKIFPRNLEEQAREHTREVEAITEHHCCGEDHHHSELVTADRMARFASAFVMDLRMIWKEALTGFLVAGFLAATVPASWWKALFVENGPAWLRLIENAAVGPIIGLLSWVCSCANIPLASLLWSNGISFGGVISFIYGDLIVIPLILIYRKYYGGRAAFYLTLVLYLSMVSAGIIVDLAFGVTGLIPRAARPENPMAHTMIVWNYTSWLDLIALVAASAFFWVHFTRSRSLSGSTESRPTPL